MKLFPFFRREGFYIWPVNFIGWLLILAMVAYSIYVFIEIDKKSHSVSDTLINFVFNLAINCVALYIIAFITSKSRWA